MSEEEGLSAEGDLGDVEEVKVEGLSAEEEKEEGLLVEAVEVDMEVGAEVIAVEEAGSEAEKLEGEVKVEVDSVEGVREKAAVMAEAEEAQVEEAAVEVSEDLAGEKAGDIKWLFHNEFILFFTSLYRGSKQLFASDIISSISINVAL